MNKDGIRSLVREWQEALGLSLWTIHVRFENWDRPNYAENHRSGQYDHCIIKFQEWMVRDVRPPDGMLQMDITDELREILVVHELLHCVMRDVQDVHDCVETNVSKDTYEQLEGSLDRALEQTVDRLARSLVAAKYKKRR
jgi:hypothetical protein